MRARRRGAWTAAACLALALVAVPAVAAPDVSEARSAPLADLWETVSDLWRGLSALWAVDSDEADAALASPVESLGICVLGCNDQSHDIDPNG